jgi:hypothetical protein
MTNAVLDTNVSLAIYSWHDLVNEARSVFEIDASATLENRDIQFRARRARVSFALTLFFNEMGWETLAPQNELFRKLTTKVPPETSASSSVDDIGKVNFVKVYLYFIKERLLPSWLDGISEADSEKKGNGVDRLCLDWAEEHRVPLISWEGDGRNGFNDSRLIPKQGAKRGIDVVTPEELIRRERFNPTAAAQRFFAGWRELAPGYLRKYPGSREALNVAHSFYRRMAENDWS